MDTKRNGANSGKSDRTNQSGSSETASQNSAK